MSQSFPPIPPAVAAQPVLPYATPMGYGQAQFYQQIPAWQDGAALVTGTYVTLPDRCVKCNAPAAGKAFRKKFYWHSPFLYLTLLVVGPVIYIIIAMIVRKGATVDFCLCPEHRKRRSTWISITWGVCLAAVAMLVGGFALMLQGRSTESLGGFLMLGFLPTILIGAIVGIMGARVLSPTKIDER
jgi:hypothetical protein